MADIDRGLEIYNEMLKTIEEMDAIFLEMDKRQAKYKSFWSWAVSLFKPSTI